MATIVNPPTVTATPGNDIAKNSTTVVITGTNFDSITPGNNKVFFTTLGASGTVTQPRPRN